MKKLILIGDSGHSKVINDIVKSDNQYTVVANLDDKYQEEAISDQVLKAPIDKINELLKKDSTLKVIIAIGSNIVRKKIVNKLLLDSDRYLSLIHPTAIVSSSVKLGQGTVVMPNAIVHADSKIGNHSIINTNSVIEHDCLVEDYVHISPSATLTGGVKVGEGTHIGAGSTIIPTRQVGGWSTIGAGAVVTSNISANTTAVGVPAKVIKE